MTGNEVIVFLLFLALFSSLMVAGMQPAIEFMMNLMPNFIGAALTMFVGTIMLFGMMFGAAWLATVLT